MSSRAHRLLCGCRTTDTAIVEWCEPCRLEWQERHDRAAADHVSNGTGPSVKPRTEAGSSDSPPEAV